MAWTEITRRQYECIDDRYASDATDAEWTLIVPLMLAVERVGRPRITDLRDVFDAILYIATSAHLTLAEMRFLPEVKQTGSGIYSIEQVVSCALPCGR